MKSLIGIIVGGLLVATKTECLVGGKLKGSILFCWNTKFGLALV